MPQPDAHLRPRAFTVQLGIVAIALAAIHALPSGNDVVLLVPLTDGARASLARSAVEAGASLVAIGPVPGSLVVRPARARFDLRMIGSGVLPLAAGRKGCGSPEELVS